MARSFLRSAALVAVVVGVFGSGTAVAVGTPAAATAIYQQRDAEGRIVLTDRPSPTTLVERAWRVDPEDSAAARQRSIDMKNEAAAVSERIRRRLEEQQRRVDDEALRDRAMRAEAEQRRAVDLSVGADDRYFESGTIYTPYRVRPAPRWRPHRDGREDRDRRDTPPRGPRFRGSEAPESR